MQSFQLDSSLALQAGSFVPVNGFVSDLAASPNGEPGNFDLDDWLSMENASSSSLPDSVTDRMMSSGLPSVSDMHNMPTTDTDSHASLSHLLDNPLTAALIAGQLKQRVQPAAKPTTSKTVTKQTAKRQKVRPKDRLDLLQKHLDSIVSQVSELSLVNEQLHRKNQVLDQMIEGINYFDSLALRAREDVERVKAGEPSTGPAQYKDWTTQQFIQYYRSQIAGCTKFLVEAEQNNNPDATKELADRNHKLLEVIWHLCYFKPLAIAYIKTEMFKNFPQGSSEEEHWLEVVRAMNISPEQMERLMVAREVYFRCIMRAEREQAGITVSLDKSIRKPQEVHSFKDVLCCEDDDIIINQIADNLRKRSWLTACLAMFIFQKMLTPLQVARCGLHSHPLFPDPVILINAMQAAANISNPHPQAAGSLHPSTPSSLGPLSGANIATPGPAPPTS